MVSNKNEAVLIRFEQHLLQISLSPKTIANYLADLRGFIRWATEQGEANFSITQVTSSQIQAYQTYLLEDLGRTPATVNRHLQALRKCCAYFVAANLATINAAEPVAAVSSGMQLGSQALSPAEIGGLLKAVEHTRPAIAVRDAAILQLLINTGLRVTEVIKLRMADVIFDYPGVHLTVPDRRGCGARAVPLTAVACRALKNYLDVRSNLSQSPHLFLTQEGNALSSRTVQRIIHRCARKANLKGVTAQLLRRTYALQLWEESGDLALVCERLGHGGEKITARFLDLEFDRNDSKRS